MRKRFKSHWENKFVLFRKKLYHEESFSSGNQALGPIKDPKENIQNLAWKRCSLCLLVLLKISSKSNRYFSPDYNWTWARKTVLGKSHCFSSQSPATSVQLFHFFLCTAFNMLFNIQMRKNVLSTNAWDIFYDQASTQNILK